MLVSIIEMLGLTFYYVIFSSLNLNIRCLCLAQSLKLNFSFASIVNFESFFKIFNLFSFFAGFSKPSESVDQESDYQSNKTAIHNNIHKQ